MTNTESSWFYWYKSMVAMALKGNTKAIKIVADFNNKSLYDFRKKYSKVKL